MKLSSFLFLSILGLVLDTAVYSAPADIPPASPQAAARQVQWLDTTPSPSNFPGATWGTPWPRGTIPAGTTFALHAADGTALPMQTWPLAYWPDGSIKWTGHAIPASVSAVGPYSLSPGNDMPPATPLTVKDEKDTFTIDTGVIQCQINKSGSVLINSIVRAGKTLATGGCLVCRLRSSPDLDSDGDSTQEAFHGKISSVTLEQKGPVRAVVKVEGKHVGADGRAWLPFILRLYFYAGGDSIRIMHTIIYDGDQEHDFISGLGIRFSVPLTDPLYDRHVRFAGDDNGVWGEAVRGLTGLQADPGLAVRQAQVAGLKTPPLDTWTPSVQQNMNYIPAFGDFTLEQLSSDSFDIRKRTKAGFCWLNSATGHRAAGLGYLGGPSGGMAFGIRNFWQSFPSQLSIRNAATDTAEVTAWLWSPEARPMDMRFYHDVDGMDTFDKQNAGASMNYEDYQPGYSTATGVARTSELMLWALPSTPSHEDFSNMAQTLRTPPLLVCRPQDYKDAEVFGGAIWGLPDRSTPVRAHIEDQLDFLLDYYEKQVDERHWYGFWYYGNIMHRYDFDRHVWRYDVGAYAWDNSEQSTDLWLWYTFLRSGRADVFRFAEAMTRHTGEVDVYHLGRFAGLGTRHGVVPWGDSAKQLRISTAENRRFYYYLTADERVGDLMREELDADRKAGEVPAERKVSKELSDTTGKPYSMNFLVGIEWTSAASAWMTEWERTGDTKYRDKLITGMKSIAALPHGWFSGGGGYDPKTGQFFKRDDKFYMSPLSASFGGFEVNAELLQLLDVPEYEKTWVDYCKYYNADPEEQRKAFGQSYADDLGKLFGHLYLAQAHSRLTAYASWKLKDSALADRAWSEFFAGKGGGLQILPEPIQLTHVNGPTVMEPVDEFNTYTNQTVGFELAGIQCLSLVGDSIPAQVPPEPPPAPTPVPIGK